MMGPNRGGRVVNGGGFENNNGRYARPLGMPQSAWPPLQVQHKNHQAQPSQHGSSGMRVVFLGGSGVKRECAGTGVFLPRRYGNNTSEPRKKTGCSTALLPARVPYRYEYPHLYDRRRQYKQPIRTWHKMKKMYRLFEEHDYGSAEFGSIKAYPNRHSIEVENQIDLNNCEDVEINEGGIIEITLIKKFEENDDEEMKQEKSIEVNKELLMTELSFLDYYDGYEIAKEGNQVELNEEEEIKDKVIKLTCASEKLIDNAIDVPRLIIECPIESKTEQSPESIQHQHKMYFVDFLGVEQFNLIFNTCLIDLVNQLKHTENFQKENFYI
ncbi:hypothetical protein TEA_022883 [Camellia sinensis var. sinensis]|uniref:Uncharacterized protein n=1 Tax=Camellia sinensis var. sinensis TaxID=542762 RepID=A0A4S4DUK3_CAMSN|nr:hypothetical protein TEA_022883 [Camellia sinensis var. sinensis]